MILNTRTLEALDDARHHLTYYLSERLADFGKEAQKLSGDVLTGEAESIAFVGLDIDGDGIMEIQKAIQTLEALPQEIKALHAKVEGITAQRDEATRKALAFEDENLRLKAQLENIREALTELRDRHGEAEEALSEAESEAQEQEDFKGLGDLFR